MQLARLFAIALLAAPTSAQVISGFNPPVVPSLTASNAQTNQIIGSGFSSVVDVRIAGNSLSKSFPPGFTVLSDTLIQYAMPMSPALGSVRVDVVLASGAKTTGTLEVVAPSEPTLRLGAGNPEEVFLTFFPFDLRAGGTPGATSLVWISQIPGPTSFPGLYDLGIGGGFERDIDLWDMIPLNHNGWGFRSYDASPVAPGKTLYFQLAEFDPIKGTLPMPTSNVGQAYFVL